MLLITRLVKILMTGAGEVTQLVKYLPHQHEDLCEPHHPSRKPNQYVLLFQCWGGKTGGSLGLISQPALHSQ